MEKLETAGAATGGQMKLTKAEAEDLQIRAVARAKHLTGVEPKPCACSLCAEDDRCLRVSLRWTLIYVCNACLGHMLQESWTAQEPARRAEEEQRQAEAAE